MTFDSDSTSSRRRRFLQGGAALTAAGLMPRILAGNAFAATGGDYRALVCINMQGGNDSNNTIVPFTSAAYNAYANVRGAQSAGGIALPQTSLLPLAEKGGAVNYAFHPSLAGLQGLYNSGALAMLFNVGSLIQPTTRSQYKANAVPQPSNLFSHIDQSRQQWTTSVPAPLQNTGWAGRIADLMPGLSGSAPMGISIAGNTIYLNGSTTAPVAVPQAIGTLNVGGFDNSATGRAHAAALAALAGAAPDSLFATSYGAQDVNALTLAATLNPLMSSISSTVSGAFGGLAGSFSSQLQQVANLIEKRAQLGSPTRQIFFVNIANFDTHGDQIVNQAALLTQLSAGLTAFYNATVALAVDSNVTAFTLSDFSRTYQPSSTGGSDHAWGSHQMIIGGAVKGGQNFGTFPTLALSGPDDATDEGRWIPTSSIDQYAATLATWFGVSPSQLTQVLPNLSNFGSSNLGFMST